MNLDNRVRMTEEDKDRLVAAVEHVLTIGHGEIIVKVANHKVISEHHDAGWELRTNGVKKG